MSQFACQVHLAAYQTKLETIKMAKLARFDSGDLTNVKLTRAEYACKLDKTIEERLDSAIKKLEDGLRVEIDHPGVVTSVGGYKSVRDRDLTFDPYIVLGLVDTDEDTQVKKKAATGTFNKDRHGGSTGMDETVIKWQALFEHPGRPLVVDAGCGSGKFLLRTAFEGVTSDKSILNTRNYLGVEIRRGLVEKANRYKDTLKLNNVAYVHAEFDSVFVERVMKTYPGKILYFCCQLPDPRFQKNMRRSGKKKLTMERIVRPSLVLALASAMNSAGRVYVSSEYKEVADDMKHQFLNQGDFQLTTQKELDELRFLQPEVASGAPDRILNNPFGCETERELFLRRHKRPVFRWVLKKKPLSESEGVLDKLNLQ